MSLTHPSPHHSPRVVPVQSVCLHWTGGSYAGGVAWCTDPRSKVSYHAIVGPDGDVATLVPWDRAAWSVGRSVAPPPFTFSRAGNSATENIALAGGPRFGPVTHEQFNRTVLLIADRFCARRWGVDDLWRIAGHADFASPRGRKVDPWGDQWLNRQQVVDGVRVILEARR